MHILRSRFWARSYFQAVLLLLTTAMMAALVYFSNGLFLLLGLVPLLAFVWLWIWNELRNKAIKIEFDPHSVSITGYYGLGSKKDYPLSAIHGYRIASLSSENGNFEYLYLFSGEKRIACISGYHHRNYEEIRIYINGIFKNLGLEPYSISNEVKEMFR